MFLVLIRFTVALKQHKQYDLFPCSVALPFYLRCIFDFLRPFQDYFSSYETGQSVGGAKTGDPREKPHSIPASRTWLVSHVASAGLEPTPDTAVR